MHITETVRVAAEAWAKTKPAEDPDFNNCQLSHRETLVAKVERLAAGGHASDDFEVAAKEILDSQLKAPEPDADATAPKSNGKAANGPKKSR